MLFADQPQGKFGKVVDENGNVLLGKQRMKQESMAEAAAAMLALEGEKIDIVTKDDKVIRFVVLAWWYGC